MCLDISMLTFSNKRIIVEPKFSKFIIEVSLKIVTCDFTNFDWN